MSDCREQSKGQKTHLRKNQKMSLPATRTDQTNRFTVRKCRMFGRLTEISLAMRTASVGAESGTPNAWESYAMRAVIRRGFKTGNAVHAVRQHVRRFKLRKFVVTSRR